MISKENLDFIQQTFINFAQKKGIPIDELMHGWNSERETNEWNIDYKNSLQSEFDHCAGNMMESIALHASAMEKGDLITAQCGLIRTAVFAQMLESIFRNVHDECYKILNHDKRFSWPEIPEDYKIPEHYEYKGPR